MSVVDPVLFSGRLLGFKPFDYQEALLRDESKRICACMGRQTGKSTTIAVKVLHYAFTHRGVTTVIVSPTLRQSILMYDKVARFVDSRDVLRASVRSRSRIRLELTNGASITALPCGRFGSTLRGYSVDLVILDEAAFIPEEVVSDVVFPMTAATSGSVWMLSTPWDKGHVFHRCFSSSEWSVHHVPSGRNPLVSKRFLDEQRLLLGEERFGREYLAEFLDDVDTYFPMDLIRGCIGDVSPVGEGGYAGYDPGGKRDYAALAVVRVKGDGLEVCYVEQRLVDSYTDFNVHVLDLHRERRFASVLVDVTGLGGPILEHLKELSVPAEGLQFNGRVKEDLMSNLRLLFEQGRIVIPDDRDLMASLNCVEYERTRTGGYRFTHKEGSHDDLAVALALACWCARTGRGEIVRI